MGNVRQGARVDWSHRLAQGLVLAVPLNEGAGDTVYDVASGRFIRATNNSALTWETTPFGHGILSSSALGIYPVANSMSAVSSFFNNSDFTGIALVRTDAGGVNRYYLGLAGQTHQVGMGITSGQWTLAVPGIVNAYSGISVVDGDYYIVAWSGRLRSTYRFMCRNLSKGVDQKAIVLDGRDIAVPGGLYCLMANPSSGGAFVWPGWMGGALAWNRALSDEDLQALFSDFWQIMR